MPIPISMPVFITWMSPWLGQAGMAIFCTHVLLDSIDPLLHFINPSVFPKSCFGAGEVVQPLFFPSPW